MALFHMASARAASSRLTKRSRGLLLRAALALVLTVCLLQLFLHVWRTNNNSNSSPPPKSSADQHVVTSLAPKQWTFNTRRSSYLGDSSPSESQHLSRRILSASRHIAFRRNNNISLCVGIPLRQLDRVDDTFAFALKDAIAYANLSHVVLAVAVNRGEEGLKEALRLQHELGGASSAYAARHITLLPLSQAQTNATLGAMLNVLLQRFATFDTEAAAAAPTSGPACSHMMFLDPSRTVMSETFFVTLIQDVELAAGAYAATCTTYRHGVDGAEPRVFDRGFNVSLGQSLGSTRPTMSRVFFGYSKRRDARLHSASPIEFLSPHCFLVNWRRLVTAATPSFSSSSSHRDSTTTVVLQIENRVAQELTVVDRMLQQSSDSLRSADVMQVRLKVLSTELTKIDLKTLRILQDAGRSAMRRGFQVLVEAQELLSTLYGSQWESRNISARMGLSQHTEQSVLSLCGTATTSQQRGSSTSPRAAGQSSSSPPPLPLSQEELTRWIVCITGLLEEQITAVQHWQAVKTATPPEEHIGWALSMAIRKLVSANNKNNKNNASMFVASPAECLVNPHNAMPVLRPFLTAQVEITAGKWLDLPSYPLQLSSAFWQEYKELAEALFPHVFAPFATALRGSTMMINNESSVNNNNSSNASPMPPLRIVWDSFCCHCCGFSNEIVNLLVPLQKRLDVRTPLEPNCFCPGLPDAVENSLERSYMPKHTFPLEIVSPEEVTVWISHTEPTRYVNPVFRKRRPDYVVGRSMYEFTKIKQEWLEPIEKDCDEVWVPAAFVAEAFINSGVNASKVVIIPEALDTYFYDPSAHNRIHLPLPPNGEVLDGESVSSTPSSIKWKHFCNRPADPSTEHHFKFFSNFKWESRKGWDVLFSAYFTAFGSDEPVSLYVLTHIWTNSGVETYDSRHNETYLREHLDELSRKLGLTSDLTRHPHFCIIIDNIEEAGIAQLYRSTDAFVLPTKGEGWGLPVMQAMSMGMPVISTAWGGQTDFMNEDNSFLIPVESVEDIPKDSEYRWEAGIKWAVPSLSATKDLMRIVVTNQTLGMKRGTAARRHIVTHFSEEAVADIVEARLYKIQQIVLERRRQMRRNVSSSSSSTAAPTSLEGAMPSSSSSPSELIIRPQAVNKRNTSVQ